MKRIIAFIVVLAMSLASVVAFADSEELFEVLTKQYGSYQADVTISFTLDKPLLIIDEIVKQMELQDEFDSTDFINFKNMVESIFDSSSSAQVKLTSSDNYKKIRLSVEQNGTFPLDINKNLKISTEYKNGIWLDLDFTDEKNPKFLYIMNNPFMDKYLVMDLGNEIPDGLKEIADMYSILLSSEAIEDMNEKWVELVKKYAKITRSGRTYTIKFDDMSAKLFLSDVFEYTFSMIQMPEEAGTFFEGVRDFADKNVIFGEDGIELKVKLSYDGELSFSSVSCSFDLNICDIAENYGESIDGLERDKSFVSFTVKAEADYKNVNGKVEVELPELTSENSISLNEMLKEEEEYEYIPEEDLYQYYYVNVPGFPAVENDDVLVPLRPLVEDMLYFEEFDIIFENGKATVTSGAESPFKTLEITEFSNVVVKDGEQIILQTPVIEADGSIMLNAEFLFKVLNLKVDYVSIGFYDDETLSGISLSTAMY